MVLSAVRTSEDVLANVWWNVVLTKKRPSAAMEKALVVWLNSTLGFLILIGYREETRGAWVDFKKPTLQSMPALDVLHLRPPQIARLARAYDKLANSNLDRLAALDADPVRLALDQAVSEAVGIPDIADLRRMLASEPVVSLTLDRLLA
jgi:hypothetical protein